MKIISKIKPYLLNPLVFTAVAALVATVTPVNAAIGDPLPLTDVQVTKTVDKSTAAPGDTVIFSITVKNNGSVVTANNVKVVDVLFPLDFDFVSSSNPTYQPITGIWETPSLPPLGSATLQLTAIVLADEGDTPENCAAMTSTGFTDTDPSNNFSCAAVTVSATPPPPPPATLVCSPSNQTVNTDILANFTATGGTGSFAWTATGGSPASGSGSTFSTQYVTAGNKSVSVTSGAQTASCQITVNQIVNPPPPDTLICSPSNQNAQTGATVNFTATGGTGSFAWTATGGSPASGTGVNFSTQYAAVGNQTVTVISGSQTANCQVNVTASNGGGNPPPATLGSISGVVFGDSNQNGSKDEGESDLSGWKVYLDTTDNSKFDEGEPFIITASPYLFSNLSNGTYTVRLELPNDWTQSLPSSTNNFQHVVTILNNDVIIDKNFGVFKQASQNSSSGGGGGGGGGSAAAVPNTPSNNAPTPPSVTPTTPIDAGGLGQVLGDFTPKPKTLPRTGGTPLTIALMWPSLLSILPRKK